MAKQYESLFEYRDDFSLESISQQSDKFFLELADCIKPFIGLSRKEICYSDLDKRLNACIKRNMGLDIPIDLDSYKCDPRELVGYAFQYHVPTVNSPLHGQNNAITYLKNCSIKTNDKSARIEGDLSAFNIKMYIDNARISSNKFTSFEHAAIILHELGHAYYSFALIGQFVTLTYSLRDVNRNFDKVSRSERIAYITSLAKENGLPSIDEESLSEAKGSGEVIIVFANELMRKFRSELGVGIYDKTLSEYLADQFAARHGAGKHLILAMSKYNSDGDSHTEFNAKLFVIRFIKHGLGLILGSLVVISVISAPLAIALSGIIIAGVTIFLFTDTTKKVSAIKTDIYDQDRVRLRRIRDSIQLRMRLGKLSNREKESYIEDIKSIDEIIENTKNNDLLKYWITRIIGDNYKRFSQQQLIESYEKLAYNKLFDKAFELNNL